jgi:hypothetical protein
MNLEIGKEYTEVELDFLTKQPTRETRVTYLGRHPYDKRYVFASEMPDDGKFFD